MPHDWEIADIRERVLSTAKGVDRLILATTFDEWVADWEDGSSEEEVLANDQEVAKTHEEEVNQVQSLLDAVQAERDELLDKVEFLKRELKHSKRDAEQEKGDLLAEAAQERESLLTDQVPATPVEVQEVTSLHLAALQFYADPDIYMGFYSKGRVGGLAEDYSPVEGEPCLGARARAVLAEHPGPTFENDWLISPEAPE
jgi:hypothetical protein